MNARLTRYLRRHHQVQGWLSDVNALMFATLLQWQTSNDLSGDVVEIGIHHGRSFILLSLATMPGEKAVAIDVFDRQDLNLDSSGRGSRRRFETNLKRYGVPDRTTILAKTSLEVSPGEIADPLGTVRFFSIDGGHSYEVVTNDLALATATCAPFGVIAVDDFSNADFPEVAQAVFHWISGTDFIPFAISRGKLYLCRRSYVDRYQQALRAEPKLAFVMKKTGRLLGSPLDVFTGFDGTRLGWLRRYMQRRLPPLWNVLRSIKARTA